MRNFKKATAMVLAAAMMMSFGAAAVASAEEKLNVALILPGKKDDVSFNQAMYEGLIAYSEAHPDELNLNITENVYEVADIEPALMDFADMGYDVVFGHGFQFMEPIVKVAPSYPETCFLLGTGYKTVENSAVYDVHLQAGGYLMGVVAALATETNKVGVIGGANAAEIYRGHEAFKVGVQSVNPDIEIQEVYTGDWTDTVGAKEAAVGMYDSGVDVIWHSGDGIGLGVVQAAKEKDMLCLGNVADQNALAPENVLTGIVYKWDKVIEKIFEDIRNDSFMGREEDERFYWITAENEGIAYAPIVDAKEVLTEEEEAQIEETYQKLVSGELELPEFSDPE